MNTRQNILQDVTILPKYDSKQADKIYHVNTSTTYRTMGELHQLVSLKKEFVIETKYDNKTGCPKLLQIFFSHRFQVHFILVEVLYLPETDVILHNLIAAMFSTIFSPSNLIRSWNDLKSELKFFCDCNLFSLKQIERINLVNIQHKFQEWFQKNFANVELNNVPSNGWSLEMCMAFLFQQHFDTSLSKSLDWNIGLFARFHTNVGKEKFKHTDSTTYNLLKDNERRTALFEYILNECFAVNKIAAIFLIDANQKHVKNDLKKFYNNS